MMSEAEGVKLQQFRLNQIKKVAENISSLRAKRESHKLAYDTLASSLLSLNSEIASYKSLFDEMQALTGISIPSASQRKHSSFLDQAEATYKDNLMLE